MSSIRALRRCGARKALLVVGAMTAHSAAEEIGIAAFGDTSTFGLLIAVAIAIQNIPEGQALSLVPVPRGTPVLDAAGWSVFSNQPQPLLAVPAFLFVEQFSALLPAALGFRRRRHGVDGQPRAPAGPLMLALPLRLAA